MAKAEPVPPLHAVTDDRVVASPGFLRRAEEALAAGGDRVALHLRAPAATGRAMHEWAIRLMEIAARTGSRLLVNDRVDVALAAGAHGVQLGRRGLSVADARRLLGGSGIRNPGCDDTKPAFADDAEAHAGGAAVVIGASVHDAAEAREAAEAGADFLLAGAVYPTETHAGRPASGLRLIEDVASLGLAVIAIGGVTPERAAEPRRAGAAGVAAIRGIWDDPSPGNAVQRYLEAWQS